MVWDIFGTVLFIGCGFWCGFGSILSSQRVQGKLFENSGFYNKEIRAFFAQKYLLIWVPQVVRELYFFNSWE